MEFASGEEFSLWLANAMTTFAGSKQPAPQEERNRAVNPTETPKEKGGGSENCRPLFFVVQRQTFRQPERSLNTEKTLKDNVIFTKKVFFFS